MSTLIDINNQPLVAEAPFKVNTATGDFDGRVSSQWFSRPDDQKFLDLKTLSDYTRQSAENSEAHIVNPKDIRIRAESNDPDKLDIIVPTPQGEVITSPNHYSFGQLSALTGAPAGYLRKLPASLAGINLQYGLNSHRGAAVSTYITSNGHAELRCATGPDYGRIHDFEVVDAVRKLAGDGNGDTNWKVPGVLNWRDGTYDPNAPITKESTTLFASDRDIFLFLVDDKHPISIGTFTDPKTGKQEDDLIFRGFYVWNSEVGNRSFGLASFYLRGVCQNRCLWGVEGYQELRFPHSKNAPQRFLEEARPALQQFSNANPTALLNGVTAAKEAVVARDDESRRDFLSNRGFSKNDTSAIIDSVINEEGHRPSSVWDFVQGITAHARTKGRTDERLDLERKAGKLLNKVA